jgi:hypothetical protein
VPGLGGRDPALAERPHDRCHRSRLPDVNWSGNHHAAVARFEMGRVQCQVDMIVSEHFMVEVEVLAVGDGGFCRHSRTRHQVDTDGYIRPMSDAIKLANVSTAGSSWQFWSDHTFCCDASSRDIFDVGLSTEW